MMTSEMAETAHARPSLPRRILKNWGLPLVLGTIIGGGWIAYNHLFGPMSQAVAIKPTPIDGERAYGYLKKICDIGPRIAGSEANTKQRLMVAEHFKAKGGSLHEQTFSTRHPLTGKRVEMVNLIGSWFPERVERVLIAAHYDTRPFPDMETDPARKKLPFIGANDCASGVALLMEIANHLKTLETPWGVDLVLLDGEELIYESPDGEHAGTFFLGSKEFGRVYKAERRTAKSKYVAGIVLDMVGGKDMVLPKDPMSLKLAYELVREVWTLAPKVDAPAFVNNVGREVQDDHLPLNTAGIPTIDIIDFEYPFWHKADDIPENCSGDSLGRSARGHRMAFFAEASATGEEALIATLVIQLAYEGHHAPCE